MKSISKSNGWLSLHIKMHSSGAHESITDNMTLKECTSYDLTSLTGPHDYMQAANSTETVTILEECLGVWIKQISEVHSS